MFTVGPVLFLAQVTTSESTLVVEDLPLELQTINVGKSSLGWQHPTNPYNVPYIYNGAVSGLPGRLVFHPGPDFERPTVRWVNTGATDDFDIYLNLIPDGQGVANYAALVQAGTVIGSSTFSTVFNTTLEIPTGGSLEITLAGSTYNGGGDMIDFSATRSSTGAVYDMYSSFMANEGAPSAMWQYFYRADFGFPAGALNSAGPMIQV